VKPTILLDALCQEILSWQNFDNNSIEKLRVIGVFFDKFKQCEPLQGMNVPLPKLPKLWSVATKILESPDDKRSIDDWSKSVGMGRRSFTKYFAQETGLSFAVWRQKVKLQTALVCLSQGLPVKEVAARLNYSPSAFIEVFRRQFGQPPKQYTSTLLSENKQQTPIRNTTLSKN
jgi:AraC-like DNA-binding protein